MTKKIQLHIEYVVEQTSHFVVFNMLLPVTKRVRNQSLE